MGLMLVGCVERDEGKKKERESRTRKACTYSRGVTESVFLIFEQKKML